MLNKILRFLQLADDLGGSKLMRSVVDRIKAATDAKKVPTPFEIDQVLAEFDIEMTDLAKKRRARARERHGK